MRPYRGVHDLEALRSKPEALLSRGERIAACKAGILPPRSSGRARQIWTRYRLTRDDHEALIEAQGGLCAICGVGAPRYVDHDHATGRVRGLLCPGCNTVVGMLEGDQARLTAAARYLTERGVGNDNRPPALKED